jgi:hypothetical protein
LVKLSQFGYSLESGSRPKGGIDSFLQEGCPSLGAEAIGELGKFDFSTAKLIPEDFYKKMKRGLGKDKDILLYKDGAYIGKVTLFMDDFPYKDYAVNAVLDFISNNPNCVCKVSHLGKRENSSFCIISISSAGKSYRLYALFRKVSNNQLIQQFRIDDVTE